MRSLYVLSLIALLSWRGGADAGESSSGVDITQLSVEQLVETEFIPASRIARQISDAPSAVSVVTAQDIRDYGYRSLADILQSMRGLYVTSSLDYEYLGGRGFGTPGDYAGRIMLTIDGYVANDNFYNQIFLGEDALLDVALIDRVEFIPGPGSTSYGNSAFLGVINVITKRGRDFDGVQAAANFGENGARRARLTYGRQLQNGAEFLASVSRYGDDGTEIRFPTLDGFVPNSGDPYTNQAIGPIKKAENHRLFFKGSYDGWALEFANVRRHLDENNFFTVYEPSALGERDHSTDDSGFVSLKYDADVSGALKSSSHVYYGQYLYRFDAPQNRQQRSDGRWWGVDLKFVGTWFDHHRLLFGGEYRDDYQQHYQDDFNPAGIDFGMRTASVYAQDEYRLAAPLTLVPGFRYDHNSRHGDTWSPRFAAIYTPWSATTLKLSYGKAFRHENPWEIFSSGISREPESVTTTEFVWQQQLPERTRLTVSLYHNRIYKRVVEDLFYGIKAPLGTVGQELGIEHVGQDNFRLNASIAHQVSEDDDGRWLVNSPKWLTKLNMAQPVFHNRATVGLEVQTIGRRQDFDGGIHKAGTITNLTLSSLRLLPNTLVSMTARNLFDEKLDDVVGLYKIPTMPQSGRNFWLQLEYNFK